MKQFIKSISQEFFFATGFAVCIGFILATFIESSRQSEQTLAFSVVFGAIPVMLAKRFILGFIEKYKKL